MNYEELIKKQYSYLDQIEFQPYLDEYDELDDIWDKVQDNYNETEMCKNDFLQGYIFNQINQSEFMEYLEQRYNIKFHEEITIKYYK